MKIQNLEVGMVVKNYKELCILLGITVEAGNSKKSQLRELERFVKYNKSGNKFVIVEIYDNPLPKVSNNRGGNHTIYGDIVQLLLVDMLVHSKEKRVSISKSKLIEVLGIANENYSDCKENLVKLSNFLNIGIEYVYDFYNINDSNFSSILLKALNSLQDKRIILYETTFKAIPLDSNKTRLMSDEEKEVILEVEKDTLIEYGASSQSELVKSGKWKKFKKECSDKIKDELQISRYYKAYDISINKKYIDSEKNDLIRKINNCFDREHSKQKLNDLVVENISKNTVKRNEKSSTEKKFRGDEEYIKNTTKLSNVLVKRSSGKIIESVRKESNIYSKPKTELQLKLEYLELDIDDSLPF